MSNDADEESTMEPEQEEERILKSYRESGGSSSMEWNIALLTSALAASYSTGSYATNGMGENRATVDTVAVVKAGMSALAPADEVEGALAVQVFALHGAIMDALHRGAHPIGDEAPEMWARAADLSRAFLASLDVLDRRKAARQAARAEAEAAALIAAAGRPLSTTTRSTTP